MKMIDSIYSVAVVVSDRKKAAQWYKEKLGFEIKEDSGKHWTVVGPANWPSGLHLCEGDLEPGNTGILLQRRSKRSSSNSTTLSGIPIPTI